MSRLKWASTGPKMGLDRRMKETAGGNEKAGSPSRPLS
jgi:hypothetical protein